MAKHVVIIEDRDYKDILDRLSEARKTLGEMRKTQKRDRVMMSIDRAISRLTGRDHIEERVSFLEGFI